MRDDEIEAWLASLRREVWWHEWWPILASIVVLYALLAVLWRWM